MLTFVSLHMIGPTRNDPCSLMKESVLGMIFYKIIPAPSGIVGGHIVPGVISELSWAEEMSHITMFTVNIKSKCCIN